MKHCTCYCRKPKQAKGIPFKKCQNCGGIIVARFKPTNHRNLKTTTMKEVIKKLEEAKTLAEQSCKLSVCNKINALIFELEKQGPCTGS